MNKTRKAEQDSIRAASPALKNNPTITLPANLTPKPVRRDHSSVGILLLHTDEHYNAFQTLKTLVKPVTNNTLSPLTFYPATVTHQPGHPLETYTVTINHNNANYVVGYLEIADHWLKWGLADIIYKYEKAGYNYLTDLQEDKHGNLRITPSLNPNETADIRPDEQKVISDYTRYWFAKPKALHQQYEAGWEATPENGSYTRTRSLLVTLHIETVEKGAHKGQPVIRLRHHTTGKPMGELTPKDSQTWLPQMAQYTVNKKTPVAEASISLYAYKDHVTGKTVTEYDGHVRLHG